MCVNWLAWENRTKFGYSWRSLPQTWSPPARAEVTEMASDSSCGACQPFSTLFAHLFPNQTSEWLFSQNAIQLQPHGSKSPIVLSGEIRRQIRRLISPERGEPRGEPPLDLAWRRGPISKKIETRRFQSDPCRGVSSGKPHFWAEIFGSSRLKSNPGGKKSFSDQRSNVRADRG